ncbi:MAG TPA: hypothetical protein VMW72_09165 [Sedimentisphaerales bacterium]|nr:hypothetical protein [Sedimentisphaerales bacterium]
MQGLRKGEWSAITQVKVFSPEICLIALGQGFLHLEASSATHDNGGCVSDVPGSESMAGHSTIHSGTWENHIVPKGSFQQAEEARWGYGGMAVGPFHIRGVVGVIPGESQRAGTLEGVSSKMQRDEDAGAIHGDG